MGNVKIKYSYGFQYIYTLVLNFLLVAVVFDNFRQVIGIPLVLHTVISLFRDLFLFFLIMCIYLSPEKKISSLFLFVVLLFTPVPVVIFLYNAFFYISETTLGNVTKGIYWTLRPLLLLFILNNSDKLYLYTKNETVKLFVVSAAIMFFLSLGIYIKFPYVLTAKYYENRISVGNPSMIATVYIAAIILLLKYKPFNRLLNFFLFFILTVACVFTLTATAITILFLIIGINFFSNENRWASVSIVVFSLPIVLFVLLTVNLSKLILYFDFFLSRITEITSVLQKYILNQTDLINSDSIRGREVQVKNFISSFPQINFIFGGGDISGTGGKYSLENTYYALFSNYGLFGVCLYLFFLLRLLLSAVKSFYRMHDVNLINYLVFLILYGMTLDLINTFSLSSTFIVVGYYVTRRRDEIK